MAERTGKFVLGVAAGAAAAAVGAAAGSAIIRGRPADGKTSGATQDRPPVEETSGRGAPNGGPDPESAAAGYDLEDARVGALIKVMLVSLAIMIGSTAAVFFMYSRFDRAYRQPNEALTAEQTAPIPPPLPHLQADPYRDIDAVLMEQTRRLTTYGWTSPDHKSAHIPIQRAIQQVIGKPLDGPAQADAAGPKGSSAPQPATPAFNANLPQDKPANRVQGEGNSETVAPSLAEPSPPSVKP